MVTTVGTESNFINLLCHLIELDYDAVAAYEAAETRLENQNLSKVLAGFRQDHLRHVKELSQVLKEHGETPPDEGDIKQLLTQGKVVIAELFGDKAILSAMKSNEEDTNTAYERANAFADLPASVKPILQHALEDERRHRAWLDEMITKM